MSTYSWSYKTAVHRQVSSKLDKTDQSGPNKNICQIESDKVSQRSSLENNDALGSGTPKRLNWRAKIYVGNLNKKTNEASLAYYFSVFGDIEDIKLIRDHNTKESRGFAFITFEKIESAEKAKKWCSFNYPVSSMHLRSYGTTLDDNSITVASAERKSHKMKISKDEQRSKRDPSQTLFWEFKWKNADDAQIYGPYETSLMQAWKNQGYFNRGCWVRQVHRQVSRAGEKGVVKVSTSEVACFKDGQEFTNTSEEIRVEDRQHFKTNTSEVTRSEQNANEESCEAGPCKKPRLVIEYSDSDDDDDDNDDGKEELSGVLDVGGRPANNFPQDKGEYLKLIENEKKNYSSLNKEYSQLHETESNYSVKEDERMRALRRYESEHSTLLEEEKQKDFHVNKADLKYNENRIPAAEGKQGEEMGEGLGLLNDEKNEIDVNETRLKNEESDHKKSLEDEVHAANMDENISEQREHEVQTQKNEQTQSTNRDKNSPPSGEDNACQISNKMGESLDILQMYEQGSTVLLDGQSEQRVNDEDLSDDYSSSDEEFEDDNGGDDDISTEFVAVSEIDFNLYP